MIVNTEKERRVGPGFVFSSDLLKVYIETIHRGLENLLGFIIGRCNLRNTFYADDSVHNRF